MPIIQIDQAMVKSYKELIGYQKAYQFMLAVYELTGAFPRAELYGLTSQMRRCVVSMPTNIADGHMRGTKESGISDMDPVAHSLRAITSRYTLLTNRSNTLSIWMKVNHEKS